VPDFMLEATVFNDFISILSRYGERGSSEGGGARRGARANVQSREDQYKV